jgi:hypothetical protein
MATLAAYLLTSNAPVDRGKQIECYEVPRKQSDHSANASM